MHPPRVVGSGANTCPMALYGPWAVEIKRLSYNGMQRGSRVSKTRLRITEAPVRRVSRRCYHDLQIVRADSTTPCYSAPPH
jgi:hypothetical protein